MNKYNFAEGLYEGYVWMSDATAPIVLTGEPLNLNLDPECNPFIIEAQLLCIDMGISYSIRYVDGQYIVNQCDLSAPADYEEKVFIPARMPDVALLKFRQYWKEVKVEEDYDWTTLKPGKLVFVGFELKEEKK